MRPSIVIFIILIFATICFAQTGGNETTLPKPPIARGTAEAGVAIGSPPDNGTLTAPISDMDKPVLSREDTRTELTKPTSTSVPVTASTSQTKEEATAWGMIYEAMSTGKSSSASSQSAAVGSGSDSHGKGGRKGNSLSHSDSECGNGPKGQGQGKQDSGNLPQGWDKGEKTGWDGASDPPGQRKHSRKRGGK